MRCLQRNKQTFYYALYAGKTAAVDEYGNETGEYTLSYDTPVSCEGNISAAKGDAQTEVFGINTECDRVIVIDNIDCPIAVTTLIFIGVEPIMTEDGNYNNNYVVKEIAKSLNSISIAISEVG